MADAELAAQHPAEALVRDGVGVAEFEQALEGLPAIEQATAEAEAALTLARLGFRDHCRKVDKINKRVYKVLATEAEEGSPLADALKGITREPTTRKRKAKPDAKGE
jgi:hypothetical protein